MKKHFIHIVIIFLACSCTNKLFVADAEFEKQKLSFITDKVSNREDIIIKLGEPSWEFENGRILTYRINIDKKGMVTPVRSYNDKTNTNLAYSYSPSAVFYSLVLVFGENNILEKHSLILTNP